MKFRKDSELKNCGRKRQYESFGAAQAVGQYEMDKHGKQLFIYECPVCKGFHLTHNGADWAEAEPVPPRKSRY